MEGSIKCRSCERNMSKYEMRSTYKLSYTYICKIVDLFCCVAACELLCVCKLCKETISSNNIYTRFTIIKTLINHLENSPQHNLQISDSYIFRGNDGWEIPGKSIDISYFVNSNPQTMFLLKLQLDGEDMDDEDVNENIEQIFLSGEYGCMLCGHEFDTFPAREIFLEHFVVCIAGQISNQTK